MSIFDEAKDNYDTQEDDGFALDEDASLALIARLCSRFHNRGNGPSLPRLRYLLKNRLPDILGNAGLQDDKLGQEFSMLEHYGAAFMENFRLPMLRDCTVVGVGGAFSAGKSRFLNAFTGIGNLPEEQDPSTAIGTYLVHAKDFAIYAHTRNNGLEALSPDELEAISHRFHMRYKIGFTDILHKLIITSPDFPENIILLDTPGYNKPDEQKELEEVDRRIAREHLQNSDYLLWLVAMDQGTMPGGDMDFLGSLEIKNPPLIIYNKADLKSEKEIAQIISDTEGLLKAKGLPVFGITAYSAACKKEYFNQGLLDAYLDLARKAEPFSRKKTLENLKDAWLASFASQKDSAQEEMDNIVYAISRSSNVASIRGLLQTYTALYKENSRIYHSEKRFREDMDKLSGDLSNYLQ